MTEPTTEAKPKTADREVPARITDYLASGGLWNPELANHDEVRDILIDARDVIEIAGRELAQAKADLEKERLAHCEEEQVILASLVQTKAEQQRERLAWNAALTDLAQTKAALAEKRTFQDRVAPWMQACFGPEISADKIERNHRFLEEALELVQSNGCARSEAHQLVDYVYGRPQGDINQEVGGVMVTLAALCLAAGVDMQVGGEAELARIWGKIDKIRAKQAAKPKHSPLPEASANADLNAALLKRCEEYRERLEIVTATDGNGNTIPFPDGGPDGIECRNETIRLQDARIDRLTKRCEGLEAALRIVASVRAALESAKEGKSTAPDSP